MRQNGFYRNISKSNTQSQRQSQKQSQRQSRATTKVDTMLATQGPRNYIDCTQDGELARLHWRHARIEFVPSELLAIADFFRETVPRLQTNCLMGNSLYCIIQDEDDNFEVWLLGVGFYMAENEFRRFVKLILEGAKSVKSVADYVSMNHMNDVMYQ
ncbi:MAG: hypothetical protein AAF639_33725 [Chloroflexota bacterium]